MSSMPVKIQTPVTINACGGVRVGGVLAVKGVGRVELDIRGAMKGRS